MPTIAQQLQLQLTTINEQIQRTKDDALRRVAELQDTKQTILAALDALEKAPEAEQLIPKLRRLGVTFE